MLDPEVSSKVWVLLAVTLPLISVAAVVAWNSYTRLNLRSPGILFLAGLVIVIASVVLLATPGHSITYAYEPAFEQRLALAFVLAAAGISNVAISLYLGRSYAKELKSERELGPSQQSGLPRLRSQR